MPRTAQAPAPEAAAVDGAAGYNLVVLVILVTVLNILVAAALPLWSTAIKRDKEEQLIFRGLQYAEAIRVFERRFGRPPVRLEELIEVEPRSIRKLWKDPMTKDGKWGIIYALPGQPGQQGRPGLPGQQGQQGQPGQQGRGAPPPNGPGSPQGQGGAGGSTGLNNGRQGEGTVTVGPIRGVYSKSTDESIKIFMNQDHYNQWHFTTDLVKVAQNGNAGVIGLTHPKIPSARWIGRPLAGVAMPPGGGLPGGGLPGQGPGVPGLGPGSGQGSGQRQPGTLPVRRPGFGQPSPSESGRRPGGS